MLQYDKKLRDFLSIYDRAFIVAADNVGSKQFQDIRRVSCDLALHHRWGWSRGQAKGQSCADQFISCRDCASTASC